MAYGIPEYRLPYSVIAHEISNICRTGVKVFCGKKIERAEFDALKNDYDAVLIAVGAQKPMQMGLPGGCITGGGQPRPKGDIRITRQKRLEAIYAEDESKKFRKSHENPAIIEFYKEWGAPGCHKSHEYLHTVYVKRGLYNQLTDEDFVVR